jgi:hypothetical protein
MRAQHLHPQFESGVGVAQVVQELGGVQAQLASAASLAVWARSSGLAADDVVRARVQERSVVCTWGPRGTLHWLAAEDLDWLLALLGPVMIAASRRRYRELGLDEDTLARGLRAIQAALANQGPMTRAELIEHLADRGIRVEGQARPYLVRHAALNGIICLGPDRGTDPTYVLLGDWVNRGRALSGETAHAELTRRYLNAYGPAGPKDQAAWSGMPMGTIRAAWQRIADELVEVEVGGAPAWILKTHAAWLGEPLASTPIVRLLPSFDAYLLGYQNRDLSVPRQFAKRVNAGGGMLHPAVLVDGRVVGTWKSQQKKDRVHVTAEPFDDLAPGVHASLEAEVLDMARFLGAQAALQLNVPTTLD